MKRLWLPLVLTLLTGCAALQSEVEPTATLGAPSAEVAAPAPANLAKSVDLASAQPSANAPQLAKTAALSLQVTDAETSSQQAVSWARQAGGEVLGLEDSGATGEVRRLTLELQVPATQLDDVLASLVQLGTLESRQIAAEDVSSQLVDVGARLRNLRKSEELLLKIMARAGSVGDVLKVTQELSQVREQIEQLDAQRVNLQNRVRYSRIRLNLTTPTGEAPAPGLGERLGETWKQATTTLGNLTVGLVQLTLWLLVFSPYLLVPGFVVWLVRRGWRSRQVPPQG